MADPAAGTYILTTKGDKITGKKITHSIRIKTNEAYTKIDDRKIRNEDVKAYQDNNAYYAKFQKQQGYEWVKQLKRGAINLYYYETLPTPGAVRGTPSRRVP